MDDLVLFIKQQIIHNLQLNFLNMKVETNFDREKGLFVFPIIIIGYRHKDKELAFVFMFACWTFSIGFCFK